MSTKATCKPHLLWFDLSNDHAAESYIAQLAPQCQISHVDSGNVSVYLEGQDPPDMLCMHFDRPDSAGLNLLLDIRQHYPSTPVTMLTRQHSEELAVWAFRAGVWDYLAVPLSSSERQRYLKSLLALREVRRLQGSTARRTQLTRVDQLPECVRLNRRQHDQQPLYAVLAHIDSHFRERIEEKEMAELCGISVVRFSRQFKQSCGVGFQEYVMGKRMQAAEDLLLHSNIPISSIAYMVGFKDPSYFARAFRQHFGYSPSACRQAQQRNESTPATLPLLDGQPTGVAL